MRTFDPIGYFEDGRQRYFLVDRKNLDLVEVPEEVFRKWKEAIEKKME